MALLEIVKYPPGDILKKKAKIVEKIDKKILTLLDDMAETLLHAGGNGMAAPQVGIPLRLIVVKNETNYYKLINPVVVRSAGEQISQEGCLSLPGLLGVVRRPEFAVIKALDASGKTVEIKAMHRLAAVFSHELDHLDGILMIDKAVRIVNYL
jgi:peptide deformylase